MKKAKGPKIPDAHVHQTGAVFKVHPGKVKVHLRDGFDVQNDTGHGMWVALPDDLVKPLAARRKRLEQLETRLPKSVAKFVALAQWAQPGDAVHFDLGAPTGAQGRTYYVVVFAPDGPVAADGDSPPKIIIEP